jgi:hypothetical protein
MVIDADELALMEAVVDAARFIEQRPGVMPHDGDWDGLEDALTALNAYRKEHGPDDERESAADFDPRNDPANWVPATECGGAENG